MMRTIVGAALLLVFARCAAAGALPDPGQTSRKGSPDLAVARQVIAGGGGSSSGGIYALSGTIAQPDADPLQPSTGGVYAIAGGFWPGNPPGTPTTDALFASGFE